MAPIPANPLTQAECTQRLHPRQEDIRGPYFRDQTAIVHATGFRRLKHKTQVIFMPENDHICTRIEHVLHVATIAGTICRGLVQAGWPLDVELAYAAGMGHDLGHAPFGHSGERALARLLPPDVGFSHELHSLRVVDVLARDGRGLNLTRGVRDAILCHNGEEVEQSLSPDPLRRLPEQKCGDKQRLPATWEGCAVRFADKIAYLGRDLEDALKAHFVTLDAVPQAVREQLGTTNGEIINTLVIDVIEHSCATGVLGFSDEKFDLFRRMRSFNYTYIYQHKDILRFERYCGRILEALYHHLMQVHAHWLRDPETPFELEMERGFAQYLATHAPLYAAEAAPAWRQVADYLAGMTDNYALSCFTQITMPEPIQFHQ